MRTLGRVSSTISSTTLLASTSASGEVDGAFSSVLKVGRKLSSTTSWWTLVNHRHSLKCYYRPSGQDVHYVQFTLIKAHYKVVLFLSSETCSLGRRVGRRRQGSVVGACRPLWQGCTTATPGGRKSWRWRCGRCTWVWRDPLLFLSATQIPGGKFIHDLKEFWHLETAVI